MFAEHPESRRQSSIQYAFYFIKSATWTWFFDVVIYTLLEIAIIDPSPLILPQLLKVFLPLFFNNAIICFGHEIFFTDPSFCEDIQHFRILRELDEAIKLAFGLDVGI